MQIELQKTPASSDGLPILQNVSCLPHLGRPLVDFHCRMVLRFRPHLQRYGVPVRPLVRPVVNHLIRDAFVNRGCPGTSQHAWEYKLP